MRLWCAASCRRGAEPGGRAGAATARACVCDGGQAVALLLRLRPWRKRQDSVPVSMMCARCVSRSTTAFASLGSLKTFVHSPNGRFVATISEPRSWRSERTWKDELGRAGGQGEVAKLVKHDKLGAGVACDDSGELAAAFGFLEFVGECGERGEAHASSGFGRRRRRELLRGASCRFPSRRSGSRCRGRRSRFFRRGRRSWPAGPWGCR